MKAAVLREVSKPLEIEDIEIAKPGPREVLLRTAASGVCHSDLHFADGAYPSNPPVVLGHEAAGVVEEVGADVEHVVKGDHVITCLSVFCGRCEHCLSGAPYRCGGRGTGRKPEQPPRLSRAGQHIRQFAHLGSFAEHMLVHENALVKIRPDMPLDRAALIGCAVMTGVGAVIHTAAVKPGTDVAVIGCGGVGLSAINGAALAGARSIIAIDRIPAKLELAKKFGATHTVDASQGNVAKNVKDLTRGGVHNSFEAIGLKETSEQAWAMLRAGGTATVIGMVKPGVKIEIEGSELMSERRLQGSNMGSNRFRIDMPRLVDFYLSGRLKLDELISDRIQLEGVNGALHNLKLGEVARQVVVFPS